MPTVAPAVTGPDLTAAAPIAGAFAAVVAVSLQEVLATRLTDRPAGLALLAWIFSTALVTVPGAVPRSNRR